MANPPFSARLADFHRSVGRSTVISLILVVAVGVLDPAPSLAANSLGLSATYSVTANLSYAAATTHVLTTAMVSNNTAAIVGELSFNVAAMRTGQAKIGYVAVGGVAVSPALDDQTLTVTLPTPLAIGAKVAVAINYSANLSTDAIGKNWQLGKLHRIVTFYRWIPWLSRPVVFDRPNFGTPYVTATSASVAVAITTDQKMIFGTTGKQTSISGLTYSFSAANVRDFNFAASPYYLVTTGLAGLVKVRVLYINLPATKLLNNAIKAINAYSSQVGAYPYSQFTVAESGGGSAMESPGMIYVDDAETSTNVPYIVAHETAHQWFYGVVGSDQASEPFADEAPTDFLARNLLGLRRASKCSTDMLDRTVYLYTSACYYETIYIQGGNYINSYRLHIGETRFWQGMRSYYSKYRFRMGGTREFWAELDAAAGSLATSHADRFPSYY